MEEDIRTLEMERDAILQELSETEYGIDDYNSLLDRAITIQKQLDDYEVKKMSLVIEDRRLSDEKELKVKQMELEDRRLSDEKELKVKQMELEKKKSLVSIIGPLATIAAAGLTAGVAIYTTRTKIKHSENLAQYVYDNEKEMRIANGKLYNISQEISK